jgi:hypothetical protein
MDAPATRAKLNRRNWTQLKGWGLELRRTRGLSDAAERHEIDVVNSMTMAVQPLLQESRKAK